MLEKVTILQHVSSQTAGGYKCQVSSHSNMYYCGMFSYSKPILSAEQEQTLVITAQSCTEMAHTRQFVTPQGRKTESIVVPGQTYIMEFSTGFQTTSNSEIRCQGTDILVDGSIQKGIVTHMEYVVTIGDVYGRRIRDKSYVIIRTSGLQPKRSIPGMCRSSAHLRLEPAGRQLYIQGDKRSARIIGSALFCIH